MSQENVEIVRRAFQAFNRRDLDAAMRDADSEVELDWSRSRGLQAGTYHGYEACRAFWSSWFDMFDRVTISPDEFIESGEHVVAEPSAALGPGRNPGRNASVSVATLRNGRILEWRLYQEKAEALEAVGLRE